MLQFDSNMATLTLLVLALFAGLACSSPSTRIAGGTPTSVEEFPSIVQVEFASSGGDVWTQSCGGHILTANYVLSAAHCFHGIYYEPRYRRITVGTNERQGTEGQTVYVDVEINHPTYGANDMDGDISVVRLLSALEYNNLVQQGPIPPQGFNFPDGLPVVLAGWGATQLGASPSNELLKTTVPIVNREQCAELYQEMSIPRVITENMICASVLEDGGSEACTGDLGGPMYYDNILVGILSFSEGCGNGGKPSVGTIVSSYTNWIIDAVV